MIITVICPLCGKKIQIEENNDANICICCNRAFITKNSQKVDKDSHLNSTSIENNINSDADRLYNNIIGLLDKKLTTKDKYLNENLERFKINFPLDNRLILIEYRLCYNNLISGNIYDTKNFFNVLKELRKYNEEIFDEKYNEIYRYVKSKTGEDYDSTMLDFKYALMNFNRNEILEYAKRYRNDLETYKKIYSEYKKEKDFYDSTYRTYHNDLSRWLNSGDTLSTPAPKEPAILKGPPPSEPRKPHNPNEYKFSTLKSSLVYVKNAEFGIDKNYLLKIYNFIDSNYDELCDEKGDAKSFIDEIFKYFDKNIQDEISERIRQRKINIILSQITKYFGEYNRLLKYDKVKKAYKYINKPVYIEGRYIYLEHEKAKFSKKLFSIKYLGDINSFNVEEASKIAFEKSNYKI